MSALPADVAILTNDGVVVRTDPGLGAALKADHPDARTMGEGEIEMFWVNPDHAQIVLDEKFAYLSTIDPLHEGVEVEETLGLGHTIPIAPITPSFRCVDPSRDLDRTARTRAFSRDTGTDRYAVELVE